MIKIISAIIMLFSPGKHKKVPRSMLRSYQVQCTMDSMIIYDGHKKIGTVMYGDSSRFSNLILKDNL